MAEWCAVTTDGHGDNPSKAEPPSSGSETVDALLAELLGPDFGGAPSSSDAADGHIRPDPSADGSSADPDDSSAVGPEDPTTVFGDAMPHLDELAGVNLQGDDESITEMQAALDDPTAEIIGADSLEEVSPKDVRPVDPSASPEATDAEVADAPPVETVAIGAERAETTATSTTTATSSENKPKEAASARSRPEPAKPVPVTPTRKSGRSAGRMLKIGVVAALGLFVLLIAAWGIDSASNQDTVVRGVTLDGESISGLSADELREVLDERQQDLATTPLAINVGSTEVITDPVTLGASIDHDEIVNEALDVGRSGFFLARPFGWLGRLLSSTKIETQYAFDAEVAAGAAESVVSAALDQPKEPELLLGSDQQMTVVPGNSGTTIDPRELVGRLPNVISDGAPYQLDLQAISADPEIDQEALEALADDINSVTAEPVRIQVLDRTADVEPAMLKSWAVPDTSEGELRWVIDREQALNDLKPLFPTLGSADQITRFTVVNNKPVIVPAAETVLCCDEESVSTIRTALAEPLAPAAEDSEDSDGDAPRRTIVLEPIVVDVDEGVAELESLGIIEEVSTFTTNHACCENRVINIQRFADLTHGVIIRPGETFSLNGHVGQRTIEKGFVADGAINLGILEPQVGGGISQYATTFFNASFFAGLEFIEYQSHSLYISRYPRGREATISWRRPDLEVRNNTPYGILVWNEYTPTSITVTFYSTKHLEVEALPLKRSSERECRVDITPRLITFPDGEQVEDSVYAVYRPGEGLDCNGNSTVPEEDEDEDVGTTTTTTEDTTTSSDSTDSTTSSTTTDETPTTPTTDGQDEISTTVPDEGD